MNKAPEEGRIWEWRAFGKIPNALAGKITAYPIRMGLSDIRGEDIYLVAPSNDQNVKLRRYSGGWVLKFKFLLDTLPGGFELYDESPEFTYQFPVARKRLEEAARLLGVKLQWDLPNSFDESEFVDSLARSSPPVSACRVLKKRSQYQFEDGWLELASVNFARHSVQSISIHSPRLEVVERILERLQPGYGLQAMNYIEACRRWG